MTKTNILHSGEVIYYLCLPKVVGQLSSLGVPDAERLLQLLSPLLDLKDILETEFTPRQQARESSKPSEHR